MTAARPDSPLPSPFQGMDALQFLNAIRSTTKGKRSKRPRHAAHAVHSWAEDEPAYSSLSEEEDLANCLVMLSNAQPRSVRPFGPFRLRGADDPQGARAHTPPVSSNSNVYQCKTCNKNFHSYQALGGHSASHSKFKSCNSQDRVADVDDEEPERAHRHSAEGKQSGRARIKIHECSVCRRVFATGQALGGHMRSHSAPSATTARASEQRRPLMGGLLDLNMPPPVDDGDDCVPMDDSALSHSLGGNVEDSHWPGPERKISPFFATPWWADGGKQGGLFVYDSQQSDVADTSSATHGGMFGGQDLDFQQGFVLVATVN